MGMWIILTLILPHSQPTLNLILSPDPDPEQSGLIKGGGGREGWNMWVILYTLTLPHSQLPLNLILSPEPLQRTSSCEEIKQKKCLNNRISKDQWDSALLHVMGWITVYNEPFIITEHCNQGILACKRYIVTIH